MSPLLTAGRSARTAERPPLASVRDEGPAYERDVALDMVRRGLFAAPALVAAAWLVWGPAGAWSSAFAIGLVLVNFLLAAFLLGWAARISLAALMGTALAGYLLRLGLITAAVLAVRRQPWVKVMPLGLSIIVTHLGLLLWETRFVSISLAAPGLREKGS
ncbi:MAG TPA: ATP synthase subunit I [Acidimicrobiales bacterium]